MEQMIPQKDLEDLANLYDRFANALDPLSEDRDFAEEAFFRELSRLHCTYAAQTDLADFRREAVRQCKIFLKKN